MTKTALVVGASGIVGRAAAALLLDQPPLKVENFYYAQEDELFAAARDRFSWSVHRPHTIIGQAVGNAMNMGTTLAVYASLCRETGRPFYFPGSDRAVRFWRADA